MTKDESLLEQLNLASSPWPLAVVIVSWNVREFLARCLESLLSDLASTPIDARVIVVDNASADGSVAMIRSRFPRVELIARDENLGFAAGSNVGLRAVGLPHPPAPSPDGEKDVARRGGERDSPLSRNSRFVSGEGGRGGEAFVLLLNPDTEVQPGAIATLLTAIRSRPTAAVVTSRLSYADGSFQDSAFRFPGLAQLYIDLFPVHPRLYETRLNGRYPRRRYDAGQPFEIDHPLGAVMLVRAEAIRQIGLFDESFALYCEEIDWCARFKKGGWRNYCVPSAHVLHHGGQSTLQARVESFVRLWMARYQLHVKHPDFAPMPLARLIVRAGMRRRMRDATDEMRAACQRIMDVWR